MPGSEVDRDGLLAGFLRDMPGELAGWRDHEAVRREWSAEFDVQLARCSDMAHAASFAEMIGVGRSEDYLQRVVAVGGGQLLCGVRFVGCDPSRPFVELIAWTGGAGLAELARGGVEAYAAFAPRAARVVIAGAEPPAVGEEWSARGDQVISAATLAQVVDSPSSQAERRIEIEPARLDEAAAFMDEAYAAFRAREPELSARVPASDRGALGACEAKGRLAWWTVDGARAGLLGVRRTTWFGLDGYLVVEEVIAEAFRGRGTAALAQRRLAESLIGDGDGLTLFGTIDCANLASRRTAARAGRREIASLWFLEPCSD